MTNEFREDIPSEDKRRPMIKGVLRRRIEKWKDNRAYEKKIYEEEYTKKQASYIRAKARRDLKTKYSKKGTSLTKKLAKAETVITGGKYDKNKKTKGQKMQEDMNKAFFG